MGNWLSEEPSTYDPRYCYRFGTVGQWLTFVALWTPLTLWLGLFGYSFYRRHAILEIIAMTWWISWVLGTWLGEQVPQEHPFPDCQQSEISGFPSIEMMIMWHFVVMWAFYLLAMGYELEARSIWKWSALGVVLAVWFWFTGNYSPFQLVVSSFIGAGIGLWCGLWIFTFWIDTFYGIMSAALARRLLGLREDYPDDDHVLLDAEASAFRKREEEDDERVELMRIQALRSAASATPGEH